MSSSWQGPRMRPPVFIPLDMTHSHLVHDGAQLLRGFGCLVIVTPRGGLERQPGVADVLASKVGRANLAIEMKVGRDKLSADQRRWRDDAIAAGWVFVEARSLDDVIEVAR